MNILKNKKCNIKINDEEIETLTRWQEPTIKDLQQELERYKNIVDETFNYCKEQQEKSFDVVAEECYAEVMYFIGQKKEELKGE